MNRPDPLAAPVRPTFDTAGNKQVPLKKDEHGNDVPQTQGSAEIQPGMPSSKR